MSDGKETGAKTGDMITGELINPEVAPSPTAPSQYAHIQSSTTTLNLSNSAEGALIQKLTPENVTVAIQVGAEIQRLQFQLAEKELELEQAKAARAHEAEQANNVRVHEREMKRLEHRGRNEQSVRWIAFLILALIALFVAGCMYRGENGLAAGIMASMTTGVVGFLGGRSYERLKERRPARKPSSHS